MVVPIAIGILIVINSTNCSVRSKTSFARSCTDYHSILPKFTSGSAPLKTASWSGIRRREMVEAKSVDRPAEETSSGEDERKEFFHGGF